MQGLDSLVVEYIRAGMTVGFDFGAFPPNFDDLTVAGATAIDVTVDGHDGTLVRVDLRTVPDYDGNFFIGLHVPLEDADSVLDEGPVGRPVPAYRSGLAFDDPGGAEGVGSTLSSEA